MIDSALMLPVILRPLPQEMLSSWLQRVASIYGMVLSELLEDNGPVPELDIDPDVSILQRVSALSLVPVQLLRLHSFCGLHPMWPLHWTTRKPPARDFFSGLYLDPAPLLQVCTHCLRQDHGQGTQFIRIRWLSAAATFCAYHRHPLYATCTFCHSTDSLLCRRIRPRFYFVCTECQQVQSTARDDHFAHQTASASHLLMKFEDALDGALAGRPADPGWVGACTARGFVRMVEDTIWALTRPTHRDDSGPAPIQWFQVRAFPLRFRFKPDRRVEHWLGRSTVSVRRALLAASAAILGGPEISRIMNLGVIPYRGSYSNELTQLLNCLPEHAKAQLQQRALEWSPILRTRIPRLP